MSLINQMLQDLESRPSQPERLGELPLGVHSAPNTLAPNRILRGSVIALGVAVVLGTVVFFSGNKEVDSQLHVMPASVALATPEGKVNPGLVQSVVPPAYSESIPAPVQAKPSARVLPPAPKVIRPVPTKAAYKANKPAQAKTMSPPRPAARVISESPSRHKPGTVDKSSPVSEEQERADQNYRNALNAYAQGRTTESIAQSRQALDDDPGNLSARQLLVRQLVEQRAPDQARSVLREGIRLHPNQIAWAALLARLELEHGDVQAARLVVETAAPQASGNADFQSLAGAIAQRQGRVDAAADYYRTALRLKPAEGRSWVGLALALEAQGNAPESREAFRRALTTEGLSPELQALAQRKIR